MIKKIHYFLEPDFYFELKEWSEEKILSYVLIEISKINEELSFEFDLTNKKEVLVNNLNKIKPLINKDYYRVIKYSFDYLKKNLFIDNIIDLIDGHTESSTDEMLSFLGNGVIHAYHIDSIDNLNVIFNEEELYPVFLKCYPNYIKDISHIIIYNYLSKQLEGLGSQNVVVQNNKQLIDHSDNKDIDKVRTLILLGVVDNLYKQPQYETSIGALATALSGVLGIKASTLRGYLNAYLKKTEDKNNPMIKAKAVQTIKNKLGIQ